MKLCAETRPHPTAPGDALPASPLRIGLCEGFSHCYRFASAAWHIHPATETIPQDALSQAAQAAVRTRPRIEASLQYCWPEGKLALRTWVAGRLAQRGLRIAPDEVVITAGAQQALSLTYRALGKPGARELVDPVCYPGALDVIARAEPRSPTIPPGRTSPI